MKKIILILFILNTLLNIHAKEKIAILELKPIYVTSQITNGVTETLMTSIAEHNKYEVIERAQINKIYDELKLTSQEDFEDETVIEIGKLAKAMQILVGSVSKLGNKYVINLRILEVETGRVTFARNIACENKDDLFEITDKIAKAISGVEDINTKIIKSKNPDNQDEEIRLEEIEIPKYVFNDDFKEFNKKYWSTDIRNKAVVLKVEENKLKISTPYDEIIHHLLVIDLIKSGNFKAKSFSTEISFKDLNLSSQSISLIIGTGNIFNLGKSVKVSAEMDNEYYGFFWSDDGKMWNCNQEKIIENIFEDENKKFHTLKIVYDAENKIVFGFIDDILIDYKKDFMFPRTEKLFLLIRVMDDYTDSKKGNLNIELDDFKSSVDFNKMIED